MTHEQPDRIKTVKPVQTENVHTINNQANSIFISGSCQEILSQAQPSRPQKRRASTPLSSACDSKIIRLTLSPIKEQGWNGK